MGQLESIFQKSRSGQRLTEDDALTLFESDDLVNIGRMADWVNRQKNGHNVFFNVNRHINPTNICALSCKFCAFSRKPGDEGAYAYSVDEIVAKAKEAVAQGATEVHMVGGLHPRWNFQTYLSIIKAVKDIYPQLHIKAFTAVELDWMARRDRRPIRAILEDLVTAGLGSLPGGGAEIFHPEIRDQICDTKVSADQWLDTHRLAHSMGLRSNSTMLYGHIESYSHRVDHMARLRALQDETGGFSAFIPLSFQPDDNEIGKTRFTYGFDDLKTVAIARLFLDNFKHIKAYWVMLGQDIAQLALNFGANDLDGTVVEEKISRMAGGRSGVVLNRPGIDALIAGAGCHGVERDTLYRPLGPLADGPVYPTSYRPLFEAAREAQRFVSSKGISFAYSIRFTDWDRLPHEEISQVLRPDKNESDPAPTALVWDLTAGSFLSSNLTAPQLLDLFSAAKTTFPNLQQSIRGMDSLQIWIQRLGGKPEEILALIRAAGVDLIEADNADTIPSPSTLPSPELSAHLDFHTLCHGQGLRTLARIRLEVNEEEESIRTLAACYGARHESTRGFAGIQVAAGEGLLPVPFLNSIAWIRASMGSIPNLITPLSESSSFQGRAFIGPLDRSPLLKIAPISAHFGSNDLGHLFVGRGSPSVLAEEIRASGEFPYLRGGAFRGEAVMIDESVDFKSARHLPSLLAPIFVKETVPETTCSN